MNLKAVDTSPTGSGGPGGRGCDGHGHAKDCGRPIEMQIERFTVGLQNTKASAVWPLGRPAQRAAAAGNTTGQPRRTQSDMPPCTKRTCP